MFKFCVFSQYLELCLQINSATLLCPVSDDYFDSFGLSKVKIEVAHLCPTVCDPMDYAVHGILQARILEWVAFPFSRGSSQPRIEPRSPAVQADSLPVEPQGKPKNTRVGSLSILQWIFLTQESNWGLLCCRQILY